MTQRDARVSILVTAVIAGLVFVAILKVTIPETEADPPPSSTPISESPYGHPTTSVEAPREPAFQQAAGYIWTGVKLYFGPNRNYCCKVLGGGRIAQEGRSKEAVLVEYPDGHSEWKLRSAVREWYVKRDDPAIQAMVWHTY